MNDTQPPRPLLSVIGLGVSIPEHITLQAARAIRQCSQIFSIVQEPPFEWLPSDMPRGVPVTNILDLYVEGAVRTDNYDRVADFIIGRVHQNQRIGYVTYGNPLAYDSVAQKLVRTSRESGTPFQVVPGISSIDTLLCDLGVDLAPGIQVYEASWLVAAEVRLDPSVAAILVQIGTYGSLRTSYRKRPEANSLAGLVEYLCRFYPRSHQVFLVRSSGGGTIPANIRNIEIDRLTTVAAADLLNCSMYIAPFEAPRLNQQILASMENST